MTQDEMLICIIFVLFIAAPLVKNELGKWLVIAAAAILFYLIWGWV